MWRWGALLFGDSAFCRNYAGIDSGNFQKGVLQPTVPLVFFASRALPYRDRGHDCFTKHLRVAHCPCRTARIPVIPGIPYSYCPVGHEHLMHRGGIVSALVKDPFCHCTFELKFGFQFEISETNHVSAANGRTTMDKPCAVPLELNGSMTPPV
jgi:hypothetical protein